MTKSPRFEIRNPKRSRVTRTGVNGEAPARNEPVRDFGFGLAFLIRHSNLNVRYDPQELKQTLLK